MNPALAPEGTPFIALPTFSASGEAMPFVAVVPLPFFHIFFSRTLDGKPEL
jgi:hypothetical protein